MIYSKGILNTYIRFSSHNYNDALIYFLYTYCLVLQSIVNTWLCFIVLIAIDNCVLFTMGVFIFIFDCNLYIFFSLFFCSNCLYLTNCTALLVRFFNFTILFACSFTLEDVVSSIIYYRLQYKSLLVSKYCALRLRTSKSSLLIADCFIKSIIPLPKINWLEDTELVKY